MAILILEDSDERIVWFRQRFPDAVITADADEAIRLLSTAPYDLVFLDHDLGGIHYERYNFADDEGTGRKVTRWLATVEDQKSTRFIVHSLNAPGSAAMIETLILSGRRAEWIPFTVLSGALDHANNPFHIV